MPPVYLTFVCLRSFAFTIARRTNNTRMSDVFLLLSLSALKKLLLLHNRINLNSLFIGFLAWWESWMKQKHNADEAFPLSFWLSEVALVKTSLLLSWLGYKLID